MREFPRNNDISSFKFTLLLIGFLIVGTLAFIAWSYGIFQQSLPECHWEISTDGHPTNNFIRSNETAEETIIDYTEINEEFETNILKPRDDFWEVEFKKNNTVQEKYGINKLGRLYEYEKKCYEDDKTIIENIRNLLDILNEFVSNTNQTQNDLDN